MVAHSLSAAGCSGCFEGDINGAGGLAIEERVGKGDDVRLGGGEDGGKGLEEGGGGRVVGPEGEDAAVVQVRGEGAQPGGFVEGAVARVEEVARRVVDVQEHGMKTAAGLSGIETRG